MSEVPTAVLYTEEHEYVRRTDREGVYQIGITDYAQGELGDVVYVELPELDAAFKRMDVFGTVEAVKAVSDLYSPISGVVVEVNDALTSDPALVNTDPYGAGWMLKIRADVPDELDQLLGPDEYKAHIGE